LNVFAKADVATVIEDMDANGVPAADLAKRVGMNEDLMCMLKRSSFSIPDPSLNYTFALQPECFVTFLPEEYFKRFLLGFGGTRSTVERWLMHLNSERTSIFGKCTAN
jgi:hypothetical protein